MSDAAAQVFQASLRDWLDGKLDLEGKRYRVLGKRPDSRPVIPPLPEHTKSDIVDEGLRVDRAVRRLTRLGAKAKFRDYADLRSGRDDWTALRIDALRIEAGQEVAGAAASYGLDGVSEASALRWVLRGLPLEMAVRKVKTDRELADNARTKRGRRRKP